MERCQTKTEIPRMIEKKLEVKHMKPDYFQEDFLVIDGSLDPSIFPPVISHGLNVLPPWDHDSFSINAFEDYPEIDFNEFRDHI